MSKQTFYKFFPDLEKLGVVIVSRKISRAKLYKLNLEHPLVRMLKEYEKEISLQLAEMEAAVKTKLAHSIK